MIVIHPLAFRITVYLEKEVYFHLPCLNDKYIMVPCNSSNVCFFPLNFTLEEDREGFLNSDLLFEMKLLLGKN